MSKPLVRNNPPVLSLTGGIGAGKSIVAKIFSVLGVPVYDADSAAKHLLANDQVVVAGVKRIFGPEAYTSSGPNRALIAERVFGDNALLTQLNSIVHPAVARHFQAWSAQHHLASYLVKEAAIAIETGIYKEADWVCLVTAPENVKVDRVMRRNGFTADDVKKRMAAQWTDDKKLPFADFIIENNGLKPVLPQTLHIHHTIMDLVKSG